MRPRVLLDVLDQLARVLGSSDLFGADLTGFDLVAPIDGIQFSQLEYNLIPVPAPAAIWLLGSGLLGLACIAKRRDAA